MAEFLELTVLRWHPSGADVVNSSQAGQLHLAHLCGRCKFDGRTSVSISQVAGPAAPFHDAQASRETAASAAADQLRRDQLALKQSKQLIPILAPAGKGKPYKSPAAAQGTATALANGTKTSALLNGGLPRKSSLESLGRMSSQVNCCCATHLHFTPISS